MFVGDSLDALGRAGPGMIEVKDFPADQRRECDRCTSNLAEHFQFLVVQTGRRERAAKQP
ncbi:hypothetical protein GCM10027597_59900 [Saccharopolyspora tripterygii]